MSKYIGFHLINKLLTVILHGRGHEVPSTHPNYRTIISTLRKPEGEDEEAEKNRADKILDLVQENAFTQLARASIGWEGVKVEDGVVKLNGEAIHTTLTQRILELQTAGLPYDSFVKFMNNLYQNPSQHSINDLFNFLEKGRFGFTDDGCFLGYKGVVYKTLPDGSRVLTDAHSKSYDMRPGNRHEMPREAVDNNRNNACGAGFHIGTLEHARNFSNGDEGGKMIVVKCNPKDVVSVPLHDTTKLRCCAYEVVHEYSDSQGEELTAAVYSAGVEEGVAKPMEAKHYSKHTREELEAVSRDRLVRMAADQGLTKSVNEGRALGKDLLIDTMLLGKIPYDQMTPLELAEFCVRRKLFSNEAAARKAGREKMLQRVQG